MRPFEPVFLFLSLPSALNHPGKVFSVTTMENKQQRLRARKQSCLCFFLLRLFFSLLPESALCCWKTTAVYFIWLSLPLLQTHWLSAFQPNDFFIITNERVWTFWHLAVSLKLCQLGLKVKEHFPHYSQWGNPSCLDFILSTFKAHLCLLTYSFEDACHVKGVTGSCSRKVTRLMSKQHSSLYLVLLSMSAQRGRDLHTNRLPTWRCLELMPCVLTFIQRKK